MSRGTLISLAKLFGARHPFLEHLSSLFHLVKPPPPQKKIKKADAAQECFLQPQLADGFNHLEKYEFVSWEKIIPNIWKVINFTFQTTNQL